MQKIGLGTYRMSDENPEHIEAIRMAVESGVTVIDTATNYMDGGAERAIARALRYFDDERRERVEIVGKAGYIQGTLLERLRSEGGYEEVVEYAPNVWHCIHPDFLRDQIEASLARLQRPFIETYLIHNPEYHLFDARLKGVERPQALDTLNERLWRAFTALEAAVKAGKIGSYGVSSNSFAKHPSDPEFLPYEDLPALAAHAAESVGNATASFTTVELPVNPLETQGLACAAWAKENGLRVLANRPLNAMKDGRMYRLAEYEMPPQYDALLNEALSLAESVGSEPLYNLLGELDGRKHRFSWPGEWEELLYGQVLPRIRDMLDRLDTATAREVAAQIGLFLDVYAQAVAHECGRKTRRALSELFSSCPDTMQRCAVGFVAGRPEIDTVLVGMRRPRYVAGLLGP
jgi:aryl-alcohol dehydrogenase-like predicted oxidoreductase